MRVEIIQLIVHQRKVVRMDWILKPNLQFTFVCFVFSDVTGRRRGEPDEGDAVRDGRVPVHSGQWSPTFC